jgi:hypothetical protein
MPLLRIRRGSPVPKDERIKDDARTSLSLIAHQQAPTDIVVSERAAVFGRMPRIRVGYPKLMPPALNLVEEK